MSRRHGDRSGRAALERDSAQLDVFHGRSTASRWPNIAGTFEVMRVLIDGGADLNRVAITPPGVTPLHEIAFGRQLEAARLLIERGAD